MYEHIVDPIQYAWLRCNVGLALPAVLARSAYRDPLVTSVDGKLAPLARATPSGVVRPRVPWRKAPLL